MSVTHWLGLDSFVPGDLLVVAVLILLEGLLSCDNAVVLALLVRDLPPALRGRALRYGILGAYVFRIAALAAAAWIMRIWYLKIAGGLYLLWMAVSELRRPEDDHAEGERRVRLVPGLGPFWSTVVAVELTDIVFSVDSIAAAVALSDKLWVLILGGLLGILAMRFAAQGFVRLLERFPRLERAAFLAVGFIGLKLLLELPADVVGLRRDFPPGTAYATAEEYLALAERTAEPLLAVPHTLLVNRAAPPEPDRALLHPAVAARLRAADPAASEHAIDDAVEHEFRRAESWWNLHLRPLIDLEGWASSLIVVVIFLLGFRRSRPRPD